MVQSEGSSNGLSNSPKLDIISWSNCCEFFSETYIYHAIISIPLMEFIKGNIHEVKAPVNWITVKQP